MEMPNSHAVTVGKADQVKELPIPAWARAASQASPQQVLNPLNMYAGSKMMAFGARKVAGKRNWPWRRKRIAEGGLEVAQGRTFVYSPVGSGRSYT